MNLFHHDQEFQESTAPDFSKPVTHGENRTSSFGRSTTISADEGKLVTAAPLTSTQSNLIATESVNNSDQEALSEPPPVVSADAPKVIGNVTSTSVRSHPMVQQAMGQQFN